MLVRAIDGTGDWTFGASLNNYQTGVAAVSEMIQTRLLSFLNDCFFDTTAGVDWFTFLGGSKNQLALELALSAQILNTPTSQSDPTPVVTGILQLSAVLNHSSRVFTISYQVQTIYSATALTNTFTYDFGGSI